MINFKSHTLIKPKNREKAKCKNAILSENRAGNVSLDTKPRQFEENQNKLNGFQLKLKLA